MVKQYGANIQLRPHFNSSEFMCKCGCKQIKVDDRLLDMLEILYDKCNAKSITITSGYRCPSYDKKIGGFVGKHAQGLAADIKIKGQNGDYVSTKAISCIAQDEFASKGAGIANINANYTAIHIDSRLGSVYRGNELLSNNSVTNDFYAYYKLTKEKVSEMVGTKPYKAKTKLTYLNVRTTPEKVKGNVFSKLKKGTEITIVETKKDSKGIEWGLIKQFAETRNGWVMLKYVEKI